MTLVPLLISSCGSGDTTGSDAGRFAQTGSEMSVTLRIDPFPPRPMRRASFTITVTDVKGAPVRGAAVECDMTMPSMMMPLNRPRAIEQDPGTYAADVLFTMAGDWEAAVTVTLPDGHAETFRFSMSTG